MSAASASNRATRNSTTVDHFPLRECRLPGGISVWSLGEIAVVMESLNDDAPADYVDLIRRRALSNLTGTCPTCRAVAGVAGTTRGTVAHLEVCEVGHPPDRLQLHLSLAATHAIRRAIEGVR